MTFGSLFAGIGGFDLGLERAGMTCKWQVEIDPFCNKVLEKHWPGVKRYGDIKTVGKHNLEPVDLICGGFPCQPFSCAGKRRGKEDDRYLWPEMLRVISEIRPTWVIGENVAGIVNLALDKVLTDLEDQGYEVQSFIIPACGVNAPHRRDRIWIIGHRSSSQDSICGGNGRRDNGDKAGMQRTLQVEGSIRHAPDTQRFPLRPGLCPDEPGGIGQGRFGHGDGEDAPDTTIRKDDRRGCRELEQEEGSREGSNPASWIGDQWAENWYSVALRTCVRGVDDGVSRKMDRVNRMKALGNAVVPQIPEIIGRCIVEIEESR